MGIYKRNNLIRLFVYPNVIMAVPCRCNDSGSIAYALYQGTTVMSSDFDQKEQRLFTAAGPLFERFGYRKTSVEDICQAAGMSKRTFYEFFRDKADFFMAFTRDWLNRTAESWEETYPGDQNPLNRLDDLIDLYAEMIHRHPSIQVFMEEPELMRRFSQQLDEIRFTQIGGTLHTILKDGVAAGCFQPMDTRLVVWLIFTLLDAVYILFPTLMEVPSALDNRRLAEETRHFILRGLGVVPTADRRNK